MSEDKDVYVLPEWAIKFRNLIDRMAPVVNEHHQDIDELKNRIKKLEAMLAQQQTTIQNQSNIIGALQAMQFGSGPTS